MVLEDRDTLHRVVYRGRFSLAWGFRFNSIEPVPAPPEPSGHNREKAVERIQRGNQMMQRLNRSIWNGAMSEAVRSVLMDAIDHRRSVLTPSRPSLPAIGKPTRWVGFERLDRTWIMED